MSRLVVSRYGKLVLETAFSAENWFSRFLLTGFLRNSPRFPQPSHLRMKRSIHKPLLPIYWRTPPNAQVRWRLTCHEHALHLNSNILHRKSGIRLPAYDPKSTSLQLPFRFAGAGDPEFGESKVTAVDQVVDERGTGFAGYGAGAEVVIADDGPGLGSVRLECGGRISVRSLVGVMEKRGITSGGEGGRA